MVIEGDNYIFLEVYFFRYFNYFCYFVIDDVGVVFIYLIVGDRNMVISNFVMKLDGLDDCFNG